MNNANPHTVRLREALHELRSRSGQRVTMMEAVKLRFHLLVQTLKLSLDSRTPPSNPTDGFYVIRFRYHSVVPVRCVLFAGTWS